jgi:hypothetical protein
LDIEYQMNLEYQIARLELRPGDILVIKLAAKLSHHAIATIKSDLDRLMPEYRAIILDGGMDLSVLSRAQIDQLILPAKGPTPL